MTRRSGISAQMLPALAALEADGVARQHGYGAARPVQRWLAGARM